MRYEVVLLDIDGTLVDSNDAHAYAWVEAFAARGYEIPFERVRPLIGMGGDKLLAQVGLDSESEEGRAVSSARTDIFAARHLPSLQPTPGARQLPEWLKTKGVTVTIATSAKAAEVDGLLRVAGVDDLLDYKTTSDDADASKPDPDIVVEALKRSGGSPPRTIMIGDTPYDIEAARGAGLRTVAFRSGGWDDAGLSGAVGVFDDPRDLLGQHRAVALRAGMTATPDHHERS